MGLKFGGHWVSCSYVVGHLIKLSSYFFVFFLVRKMGFFFSRVTIRIWVTLLKIVTQIRRVSGFGGGYPGAPRDLHPSLGQILGTCLAVRASGYLLRCEILTILWRLSLVVRKHIHFLVKMIKISGAGEGVRSTADRPYICGYVADMGTTQDIFDSNQLSLKKI